MSYPQVAGPLAGRGPGAGPGPHVPVCQRGPGKPGASRPLCGPADRGGAESRLPVTGLGAHTGRGPRQRGHQVEGLVYVICIMTRGGIHGEI